MRLFWKGQMNFSIKKKALIITAKVIKTVVAGLVIKSISRVCPRINSGDEMSVIPGLALGNETIKTNENFSEWLLGKWE